MYLIKFERHLQARRQIHLLVGVVYYGVNHNPEFALINYHAPILMTLGLDHEKNQNILREINVTQL